MKFINFDDIRIGDLFLWKGKIFLKIKKIKTPSHIYNAINIDDGTAFGFGSSVCVKRYEGEVIIDLEEFTMYKED